MDSKQDQLKKLVLGGMAGTIAKTSVAPFERVRIMAQTGHAKKSMTSTARVVVKHEGVVGLWRGNFTNCVRVFPSRGILFSCNDLYKTMLARKWIEPGCLVKEGKAYRRNGDILVLPLWMSFSAGSLAGMTACVFTYPLDVARTRISGALSKERMIKGSLFNTMKRMYVEEGVRSWFRGMGLTLAGSVPYEGIKFLTFDLTTQCLLQWTPLEGVGCKLVSGAIAGATAGFIMFPNDTVRRLLQMQGANGSEIIYRSAWHCAKTIFKQEGLPRFFRGINAYIVRIAPNSAIQFTVYEFFRERL